MPQPSINDTDHDLLKKLVENTASGGGGGGGAVASVFGRTGAISAQNGDYTKAQVGLGSVDNTSDAAKPISTATQTALNLKAPLKAEAVNKAFVSLQGNDGTAALGNRSLPFATVLAAYNAISALTPPTGLIVFTDAFQDPPAPYNFFSFDWTGDWSQGIGLVSDGYAHDPASINMRLVGPTRQNIWIYATNCFVSISTDAFDTDNFIGADVILENVGGARWRLDLSEDVATTASTVFINGGDLTDLVFTPNSGPSPITILKNLESLLSISYNLPSGNISQCSLYNCRLEDNGSIALQTANGTFGDFLMAGGGTKSNDGGGSNIFLQRTGAALNARFVGVNFAGVTSNVITNATCVGGSVTFENCTGVKIQDGGTSNAFRVWNCPNFSLDGALGAGSSITSPLIRSGRAMSDGAGASLGTLTNAPAAGNPTKWLAVDDNGTTRWVPSW